LKRAAALEELPAEDGELSSAVLVMRGSGAVDARLAGWKTDQPGCSQARGGAVLSRNCTSGRALTCHLMLAPAPYIGVLSSWRRAQPAAAKARGKGLARRRRRV